MRQYFERTITQIRKNPASIKCQVCVKYACISFVNES